MTPALLGSPPENTTAPGGGNHPEAPNQTSAPTLSFSSPKSVKGRVLGAFLRGERLTHKDCWIRFGSSRLSHHVYELRRTGWPVLMFEQSATTSDGGRTAIIGVYYLTADAIAAAGDEGQDYAAECQRVERERRAA